MAQVSCVQDTTCSSNGLSVTTKYMLPHGVMVSKVTKRTHNKSGPSGSFGDLDLSERSHP